MKWLDTSSFTYDRKYRLHGFIYVINFLIGKFFFFCVQEQLIMEWELYLWKVSFFIFHKLLLLHTSSDCSGINLLLLPFQFLDSVPILFIICVAVTHLFDFVHYLCCCYRLLRFCSDFVQFCSYLCCAVFNLE